MDCVRRIIKEPIHVYVNIREKSTSLAWQYYTSTKPQNNPTNNALEPDKPTLPTQASQSMENIDFNDFTDIHAAVYDLIKIGL